MTYSDYLILLHIQYMKLHMCDFIVTSFFILIFKFCHRFLDLLEMQEDIKSVGNQ